MLSRRRTLRRGLSAALFTIALVLGALAGPAMAETPSGTDGGSPRELPSAADVGGVSTSRSGLAFTGTSIAILVLTGTALAAVGGALVIAARKQSDAADSASS